MKRNDIADLRRRFTFSRGEFAAKTNEILSLCDEVEQLRKELELTKKTNLELAKQLAAIKI